MNCKTLAILVLVTACQPQEAAPPTGPKTPYAIGSSTLFIHDESRSYDSVGGIDAGIRTLITETWYPVDHESLAGSSDAYRKATYGDYVFGDRAMHRRMMTKTTFFHLTPDTVREGVTSQQIDAAIDELFSRERGSFVDAPIAEGDAPWPVIVMTHGDAGSRYNMESACEYLAAHGYFVIAPEHTGNSPYSMSGHDPAIADNPGFREKMSPVMQHLDELGGYGTEEHYGQSYTPLSEGRGSIEFLQYLDRSLLQRLNDLRATLDELDRMNSAGPLAGRLNLERIGLMGRSFGGTTTLLGLAMEPRFTAGFSVVPAAWADPRPALPVDTLAAPDEESVLLAAEGPFPVLTFDKPTFLLSGAEDRTIIGLGAAMAATGGVGAPTPENPHPLLRQAYESSDAPIVWGLLADSNHASFGISGSYWWPELKPDTQMRYFEPDGEFTLVKPALAHQLQKELALAFFDLTIREDAAAKPRLLENRYQPEGLTLESRNFE